MSNVRRWFRAAKDGPDIFLLFYWTIACLRVAGFPFPVCEINRLACCANTPVHHQTKLELQTKKKSAKSYYCGNVIAFLRLMLLMWGDHFGWSDHFRSCRNSDHFLLSGHYEFPSFRPLEALLSVMILGHLHTTYTYRCCEHVFMELAPVSFAKNSENGSMLITRRMLNSKAKNVNYRGPMNYLTLNIFSATDPPPHFSLHTS
jgi:hypothetical protein